MLATAIPNSVLPPRYTPTLMPSYVELLPTAYGAMFVLSTDGNQTPPLRASGFGLNHADLVLLSGLLRERPSGAVVVDGGANFGVYSLGLRPAAARILAFEAQRVLFDLLDSSVAQNGYRDTIRPIHAALSNQHGRLEIPHFDYTTQCSFGSIEFGKTQVEQLAQQRNYDPGRREYVPAVRLDDYKLARLDLLKLDVEGMEVEALEGAVETIDRCRPVLFIEWKKAGERTLRNALARWPYRIEVMADDLLCIPEQQADGGAV